MAQGDNLLQKPNLVYDILYVQAYGLSVSRWLVHLAFLIPLHTHYGQHGYSSIQQNSYWGNICQLFAKFISRCAQSISCVQLFATPWTVAHQAPLSMEFSRQEYWSGLPFPPPGIFVIQGLNPCLLLHLLHWKVGSLPLCYLGNLSNRL